MSQHDNPKPADKGSWWDIFTSLWLKTSEGRKKTKEMMETITPRKENRDGTVR